MTRADDFDRCAALDRLDNEHFDVVVIGGGITGAGVALDAANRGLTTAVVEMNDFASGTSSKSSKLVHGGLRYLQQGEIGLVYEALAERQVLRKIAPHLVEILPFLIPMFRKNGLLNPKLARALGLAMWQYDLTGGLRIGKRHKRLSKEQVLEHMPCLDGENLDSGYLYFDARADDARLTLELLRTAVLRHGAVAVNRCRVMGIHKNHDGASAIEVEADGRKLVVTTKCVVNATGVWTDSIRELDEGVNPQSIRPAKGVHIAVPRSRVDTDVAVVVPTSDRRSVFVVPWDDVTYVGTTDTDYHGEVDEVSCTAEDIDYLLAALNKSTTSNLTRSDVVGSWAGLRPLVAGSPDAGGKTKDLSRRHSVDVSTSGVVTVTGGKLTTYRRMASDAVDVVTGQLGLKRRCRTAKLAIVGACEEPQNASPAELHLYRRYGSQARVLAAMVDVDPTLGKPLVEGLSYLKAEAVYAVRHEMATTLDDVMSRRTRARLLDASASRMAAEATALLIAPELGWSETRIDAEVAHYHSLVDADLSGAAVGEQEGTG